MAVALAPPSSSRRSRESRPFTAGRTDGTKVPMLEKLTPAQAQNLVEIFIRFLREVIQPLDIEITAHNMLIHAAKELDPKVAAKIDAQISALRNSPALQELMRQRYDIHLERSPQQFVEGVQDLESLASTWRDLKPGQLN